MSWVGAATAVDEDCVKGVFVADLGSDEGGQVEVFLELEFAEEFVHALTLIFVTAQI